MRACGARSPGRTIGGHGWHPARPSSQAAEGNKGSSGNRGPPLLDGRDAGAASRPRLYYP